jgi:hypothetical protein
MNKRTMDGAEAKMDQKETDLGIDIRDLPL